MRHDQPTDSYLYIHYRPNVRKSSIICFCVDNVVCSHMQRDSWDWVSLSQRVVEAVSIVS